MNIAIIIVGLGVIFLLGMAFGEWFYKYCNSYKVNQSYTEEIQEQVEEEEPECLSEEDENKIVKFALKQMKYSYEKPDLGYFHTDYGRSLSSHRFHFFLQLQDVSVRVYAEGPVRWESDTVCTMLHECAKYLCKEENPFSYVKISLHTYKDEDEIDITDWKTIEKFVDIMYDKVYGKNFRTFVREVKAEEDRLTALKNQYNNEIYNKIGIRGK